MGHPNLLHDAFYLVDSLDKEQLEERLEWLESAVAIYRTLLVLKELESRRKIELPSLRSSVLSVPEEPPREKNVKPGTVPSLVLEYLEKHGPTKATDIARETNLKVGSVSHFLYREEYKSVVKLGKLWALRSQDIARSTEDV